MYEMGRLRRSSLALVAVLAFIIGSIVGSVLTPPDHCAAVQNVYRGTGWVLHHAQDAAYDARHGHLTWAQREGLDIGCALTRVPVK